MPIKVTILGCFPVCFKVLISLSKVSLAMELGSTMTEKKEGNNFLNCFILNRSLVVSKLCMEKSGLIEAAESVQRRQ